MKISIAMATYNGADYIEAQLQSFVDQTRQPDEVIITDDQSSDNTVELIEQFASRAPFEIKVTVNKKNLGYAGNFNAALMNTTGDLVFLSDQDDVWFPEKIKHMLQVAERKLNALVLMNDAALTDRSLNEVGLTKIGQIRSAGFSMESFVMGCCCAIRRELLDICLPIPDGYKAHDNWLVAFGEGLEAKIVEERVLQFYRRHESNESQFIVNSTTKVTRLHVLVLRLKNLFSKEKALNDKMTIEQLKLFDHGVRNAIKTASASRQDQLIALSDETQSRIQNLLKRSLIRDKWLLPRLVAIYQLWVSGGYSDVNGLKSAVRDVLG